MYYEQLPYIRPCVEKPLLIKQQSIFFVVGNDAPHHLIDNVSPGPLADWALFGCSQASATIWYACAFTEKSLLLENLIVEVSIKRLHEKQYHP
jgi:hypothetical protein